MGCMKNYLLLLLEVCAPQDGFAQDAIEAAVCSGEIQLTYDPMQDTLQIIAHLPRLLGEARWPGASRAAQLVDLPQAA